MKFFPPDGKKSQQVALTSGHLAVVEEEGTELDARFHREAMAIGCRTEGMKTEDDKSGGNEFVRKEKIAEAMLSMVDDGNEDDFTAKGLPDVKAVEKRVGFDITAKERDEVWEEIKDADD